MSNRSSDTRIRILEAARRRLEKQAGTVRLEDVAREAKVSRQAVYLHFGSRVGLFEALVEHIDAAARSNELSKHIRSAPDGPSALDAVVEHRASYVPRVQPAVQTLIEDRRRDPAAAAAYASRQAARREEYTLLVRRLMDEGRLTPGWSAESALDALCSLLSITTWEQLVLESGWSQKRYAKHMKAMARRILVRNEP